jgi:hypothetical protein
MRRLLVPLLAALLTIPAVAGAASAGSSRAPRNFGAFLTGSQEVPPRETNAKGVAAYRVLRNGDVAFIVATTRIENVFAAHIHCGDRGVNGPVVQLLFEGPVGAGPRQGILSTGTFDPDGLTCTFPQGTVPLLDAMRAGRTYTNVHTNDGVDPPNTGAGDFPGGEIRGQNHVLF